MTLQFEQGLFRYLIEARGDETSQHSYLSTATLFVLTINFLVALVAMPLLYAIGYEYGFYLVALVALNSINAVALNAARGLGHNNVFAAGSCINGSTNVALNVVFIAVLRMGVVGMLLANLLSTVVSLTYLFAREEALKSVRLGLVNKDAIATLARYSFPLIPYTLCWWVINVSDRVIISQYLGAAANGIYAIAYKFPSIYTMATNIFQIAWMESASENADTDGRNEYYQAVHVRTVRLYSSCSMGITASLPLVFWLLVRNDFTEAYPFIPLLMMASLLQSVSAFYGSIYFAFKETKRASATNIISAIINIVINLVFVKVLGIYAAAFSTLLAYIVVVGIRYTDMKRLMGISLGSNYVVSECFAYAIVLAAYYSRYTPLQALTLITLVPFCVYRNRDTLQWLHSKAVLLFSRRHDS